MRVMFPIFEKLGGEEAAISIIRESGEVRATWPTKDAVKVWRRNGELPGTVIKALMSAADARSVPYCARDFQYQEQGDAAA